MLSLTKPDVICTHESDLDGLVSGLLLKQLARTLFGVNVPLQAYHNHNWKQRTLTERCGWVADMAFETKMDRSDWLVIDHHTTDVQPKRARLVHDITKSAGLLVYEICKENGVSSEKLDRLVHLNNVSDLFLIDDKDFDLANDYANLVKSYQFWNLHELIQGDLEKLLDHPLLEVMAVKRRVENPLGYDWSKSRVSELSPTVGFVDTVIGNSNLIVHQLLQNNATRYSVLTTLFRKGNGTMIASFRSRNGDAIKVAEKLHGGGHANASGATLPRSVTQESEALDFIRQVLNPGPIRDPGFNTLEGLFDSIEIKK